MSYILDALRKSESERRQGRVPDLGQQVQLIHKPKKKSSALAMWIGAGLALNAVVLAVVFWPEPVTVMKPAEDQNVSEPLAVAEPAATEKAQAENDVPEAPSQKIQIRQEPAPSPVAQERPTIIVPSRETANQTMVAETSVDLWGAVPHLVEMPLAFQKSIPDLVFNSHIYASEPSSRRVMINNNYLKAGEFFSGMRVERITEEGIVLSKNGQPFRVGIVRDWMSPK